MRIFKDTLQRDWDVSIDVNAIKRVRDLAKFELFSIVENEGASILALRDDYEKLANILYAICEPQCRARGISDEDFGRGIAGDCFEIAWQEIIGGMGDFFPVGRRRILATAAANAGLTIRWDEQTKLDLLGGELPAMCGAKSSGLRGVLAWLRGRTRGASCR
jgi:hypothetical protein